VPYRVFDFRHSGECAWPYQRGDPKEAPGLRGSPPPFFLAHNE